MGTWSGYNGAYTIALSNIIIKKNMTICIKLFVTRNYYKRVQEVNFFLVRNGVYDFRTLLIDINKQQIEIFNTRLRVIAPVTVTENSPGTLQINCALRVIYVFSTIYGNITGNCTAQDSLLKVIKYILIVH